MCRVWFEGGGHLTRFNLSLGFARDSAEMVHAVAQIRRVTADPLEIARMVIVSACALALIAAGQVLPM